MYYEYKGHAKQSSKWMQEFGERNSESMKSFQSLLKAVEKGSTIIISG